MANREFLDMPANAPQQVQWFLASYYPTDADGQTASEVGVQFKTWDAAMDYARTKLAAEGVGVVFVQPISGYTVYPLFEPESA